MANIDTELTALMNAVYGEEVRSAFRDALLKMNNDVIGLITREDLYQMTQEEFTALKTSLINQINAAAATARETIPEDYSTLSDTVAKLLDASYPNIMWQAGSLSDTGSDQSSDYVCRSNFIPVTNILGEGIKSKLNVSVTGDYKVEVYKQLLYDRDKNFIRVITRNQIYPIGYSTTENIPYGTGTGDGYVRLVAGCVDSDNQPVSHVTYQGSVFTELKESLKVYTTLSWLWEGIEELETDLDEKITDLKAGLSYNQDSIININNVSNATDSISVYATASGWRLRPSDGKCQSNSDYSLVKYQVQAGDIIEVVSDDYVQFQNSSSVPSIGTSSRIGETYGIGKYFFVVPNNATYIIFSTPTANSAIFCKRVRNFNVESIKTLTNRVNTINTLTNDGCGEYALTWENGGIGLSSGYDYVNAKAIRAKGYYKFDAPVRLCKFLYDYSDYTLRWLRYTFDGTRYIYDTYGAVGSANYMVFDGNALDYYYRFTIENTASGASSIDIEAADHVFARVDNYEINNDAVTESNLAIKKKRIAATTETGMIGVDGTTSSSFKHIIIDVTPGKVYYVTGYCFSNPARYPLLYVKNTDGDVIDAIGLTEQGYLDYRYIVPDGGVSMYVSGRDNESSNIYAAIVKEEIIVGCSHISEGKHIAVGFGDSLMEGVGVLRADSAHNPPQDDVIHQMIPLVQSEMYNAGIGGGTYSTQHANNFCAIVDAIVSGDWSAVDAVIAQAESEADGHKHLTNTFTAIKALDFTKVDYVLVAYGTNDWNSGYALDNENNKYDTTTILGGMRYGIKELLTHYPQLRVYVFTPCYRWAYNSGGTETWNSDTATRGTANLTLPDVCEAIKECADGLKVPCKNLYYESNVNEFTRTQYLVDGTHRNAIGYALLAEQYARFVMSN